MLLLALASAHAASLDQVEVGGPWGSPTSTDATAVWWNPAGMALGEGHRYQIEVAPVRAGMVYDRADPNGGSSTYETTGLLPFIALASDLGTDNMALGAALVVPQVRGGTELDSPGVGRYQMRYGRVQAIYGNASLAWSPVPELAIGGMFSLVRSSYAAEFDRDTLPQLADALDDANGSHDYTDADLEQEDYRSELSFDLADTTVTFGASMLIRPVPNKLDIGVTYIHGTHLENQGPMDIAFYCPPQSDQVGRFAAESRDLCNTDMTADGTVSFKTPHRIMVGVAAYPNLRWRVELMGAWVGWGRYTDFKVKVENLEGTDNAATKEAIEQTTFQARDAQNTWWAGGDVKFMPTEQWVLGARVIRDNAAVPDANLSPNNYDADSWLLTGLVAYAPVPQAQLGLSYTHHVIETRTADESAYGVTVEGDRKEDRYYYPHSAGTYAGSIRRLGFSLRGQF